MAGILFAGFATFGPHLVITRPPLEHKMPKRPRRASRQSPVPSSPSRRTTPSPTAGERKVVFLDLGDVVPNAGERLNACLTRIKSKHVPGITHFGYRNDWLHGTPMLTLHDHAEKKSLVSAYAVRNNDLDDLRHALERRYGADATGFLGPASDDLRDIFIAQSERDGTAVVMLNFPAGQDPDLLKPDVSQQISRAFVAATLKARRLAEVPLQPGEENQDRDQNPSHCGLDHLLKTIDHKGIAPRYVKQLTKALLNRGEQADLFGETADPVATTPALLEKLYQLNVRPLCQVLHTLVLRQPGHSETHKVYQTYVRASFLRDFCQVKRMMRDKDGKVLYQQRKKIKKHINGLAKVFDSPSQRFMASNIVLAFNRDEIGVKENDGTLKPPQPCADTQVKNWPAFNASDFTYAFLLVTRNDYADRPLYVIDGQQRMMALEKIKYPNDFDIPVFIYGVESSQFNHRLQDDIAKINKTHPFSKTELRGLLAAREDIDLSDEDLEHHRVVHYLFVTAEWDSVPNPFHQRIKILQIDEEATISADRTARMAKELKEKAIAAQGSYSKRAETIARAFACVADVFPAEWAANPSKSYLTGGVGLIGMGKLFTQLFSRPARYGLDTGDRHRRLTEILEGIKDKCFWMRETTDDITDHPWRRLQNNEKDYGRIEKLLTRAVEDFVTDEATRSP